MRVRFTGARQAAVTVGMRTTLLRLRWRRADLHQLRARRGAYTDGGFISKTFDHMPASDKGRSAGALARWEHYEHSADIGVRGIGATKAEAFEQAALALTAVVTDPRAVEPHERVALECEAPDDELLLAEWLNALVLEMATRKMLFARFLVRIETNRLTASAWGEKVDVARHHPAAEVKGATYTTLRVARDNGVWLAQTVVDV